MTPWELRPWRELPERFEVSYLLTGSNGFALPEGLRSVRVRALRDLMPRGPLGEVATGVLGDRYLTGDQAFASADIVHAEELAFWFAADAARRRKRGGFKLVQTVWETIPLLSAFRNRHARIFREQVLARTDLFLPATERAADALRLEGVEEERILVCPPGIDVERFARAREHPAVAPREQGAAAVAGEREQQRVRAASGAADEHLVISPGRLVWEKGHHDVIRALAALHRGLVRLPDGSQARPRLSIVGSGPEEQRLRAHAQELGIADAVKIGSVPYERMPAVFAGASAMVLASESSATAAYHPFDVPRAFWEEQFGMVLAEAMACGLAILASTCGAIPEVLDGAPAELFAPGDWMGIARALAAGPLSRPPGERVRYPRELLERYSTAAAARRLAAAYDRVLGA